MKLRSKVFAFILGIGVVVGMPTAAFASVKSFDFTIDSTWDDYWNRVPRSSDNDYNMSAQDQTGYFITDMQTCPNSTAVYSASLIRDRSFVPDITELSHGDRKYCATQYQNLSASWPSGKYHFGVHPDPDAWYGHGFVSTYWF